MRCFKARSRAPRRAGRVAIGWSMCHPGARSGAQLSKTKNPSAMRERVFGPDALAAFIKRPQADDQIGAECVSYHGPSPAARAEASAFLMAGDAPRAAFS